jgi:hypothetical protein
LITPHSLVDGVITGGGRKLATLIRWNRAGRAELYGGTDDAMLVTALRGAMLVTASRGAFMQGVTIARDSEPMADLDRDTCRRGRLSGAWP